MKKAALTIALMLAEAVLFFGILFAVRQALPEHPISLRPEEVTGISLDDGERWGAISREEEIAWVIRNLRETTLGESTPCDRARMPKDDVIRRVIAHGAGYETLYICRDGRLIYFDGREPYSGVFRETGGPGINVSYLERFWR